MITLTLSFLGNLRGKRDNFEKNVTMIFSGEKVLCYHGPLIYEAKCLKFSVTKEKQIKYYIHYAGWNKKYVLKKN